MEALTILTEIKSHCLHISTIDGNLHVQPRDRITDSIRATIRQHKAALVDFLEKDEGLVMEAASAPEEQIAPVIKPLAYKLYHLPRNWPLPWCWFAVLEPSYIKEFADLCTLPQNHVYLSGHDTQEKAIAYESKLDPTIPKFYDKGQQHG